MVRNRIHALTAALAGALLLAACGGNPERPDEDEAGERRSEFPATFTGTLPCADCPGIDYTLELLADGSFVRRADYRGRGREDEMGRWLPSSDRQLLVLKGSRGEIERFAREGSDRLRKLDQEGRRIDSPHNYQLMRRDDLPALQPRLSLRGLYSPGSPFLACSSGRQFAVVEDLGSAQLESAYLQGRGAPGTPALVAVEARIAQRPDADGVLQPMLEVLRFERLLPQAACPRPFAALPLRDTRWRVVQLGGMRVTDDDNAPAPFLRFEAAGSALQGFTGCNRLVGEYQIEGSALALDELAATRRACPGAALLEITFTDALKAVARWNVLGDMLELYNDAGELLMRLQGEGAATLPNPSQLP